LNGEASTAKRKSRQLNRFYRSKNSDEVFGTHNGISKKELDAIGSALEKEMPDVVKQKLAASGLGTDGATLSSIDMNAPGVREDAIATRKSNPAEMPFGMK